MQPANVTAPLGAIEINFAGLPEGFLKRTLARIPPSDDRQHAPAVGDEILALEFGPRMVDPRAFDRIQT